MFVRAGNYNEVVVPLNGVNLRGGFDAAWVPGPRTDPAHRVTVTGRIDDGVGGDGEFLTVRAHDLVVPVEISEMVLVGPHATLPGKSSYVVHAIDAVSLTLSQVDLVAGNGAAGVGGSGGTSASPLTATAGMNGLPGGAADEYVTACDATSRGAGGLSGINTCGGAMVVSQGGTGGAGGTMDTFCGFPPNYDARPGVAGGAGTQATGGFGGGGAGGPGLDNCGPAGAGEPGRVTNGLGGAGGVAGGAIVSGYWFANVGGAGGIGNHGGGGGGGGGSGGCDIGTDSYGAGGGGGGAGGCRAPGAGGGGGGAGGSFGIFALGSNISFPSGSITRGSGGTGGIGGLGGQGQAGGSGGPGGPANGGAPGGAGGAGGHGGHGGGGGGGAGGISYGIYRCPTSTVTHAVTITGGSAGSGGGGGSAVLDGAPGAAGAPGSLGTVGVHSNCGTAPSAIAAGGGSVTQGGGATCDPACVFVDVPGEERFTLEFLGAAPNPIGRHGVFSFTLPAGGRVRIDLLDASGRRVKRIADGEFGAGPQTLIWDGRLDSGVRARAGVYLARFEAMSRTITRRIVVTP